MRSAVVFAFAFTSFAACGSSDLQPIRAGRSATRRRPGEPASAPTTRAPVVGRHRRSLDVQARRRDQRGSERGVGPHGIFAVFARSFVVVQLGESEPGRRRPHRVRSHALGRRLAEPDLAGGLEVPARLQRAKLQEPGEPDGPASGRRLAHGRGQGRRRRAFRSCRPVSTSAAARRTRRSAATPR